MINPSHNLLKVGVSVKGVQENEHSIKYCFIVVLKCKIQLVKNIIVCTKAFHIAAIASQLMYILLGDRAYVDQLRLWLVNLSCKINTASGFIICFPITKGHVKSTHHCWHSTRLGGAQCLDHLEHIHYSLCLTAINHSGQGTEHATTSHCVTRVRETEHVTM